MLRVQTQEAMFANVALSD